MRNHSDRTFKDEYLGKITAAIAAARASDMPVIYVVVGFRAGFPEISSRNKSFGAIKENAVSSSLNQRSTLDYTLFGLGPKRFWPGVLSVTMNTRRTMAPMSGMNPMKYHQPLWSVS
jgi:nicotinamidase-related amidase